MKTMLNVALPKGRLGEKVYNMFAQAGFPCPSILENSRKLIFENPENSIVNQQAVVSQTTDVNLKDNETNNTQKTTRDTVATAIEVNI